MVYIGGFYSPLFYALKLAGIYTPNPTRETSLMGLFEPSNKVDKAPIKVDKVKRVKIVNNKESHLFAGGLI